MQSHIYYKTYERYFMITVKDVRVTAGDSAFLVDDGKCAILYDTGFGFTGYGVCEKVKEALGDRPLDYIFLTHSHYDHALGSAYVLKSYPEAKVVAGEYAKKIFEKPSAKAVMRDLDRKFAQTQGILEYDDLVDDLKVDIPVNDGDIIEAGDMKFRAISLPGHTRCSFGFYLESEKILLSCETIGIYVGEPIIMPSFLVGYRMTLDSIDKVRALDIEKILIPHFGLIDGELAKFYLENTKKSNIEICREIATILKFGGTTEEALQFFKNKIYKGKVIDAYPFDAFLLNTNIMIELIKKEIL